MEMINHYQLIILSLYHQQTTNVNKLITNIITIWTLCGHFIVNLCTIIIIAH